MEAGVVILADGVNFPAQKARYETGIKTHQAAVGAKEIIEPPGEVIEDRFNLHEGEGAARLL